MFGGCQLPSIRPSRWDSNSWILVRHEANVHAEVLKASHVASSASCAGQVKSQLTQHSMHTAEESSECLRGT